MSKMHAWIFGFHLVRMIREAGEDILINDTIPNLC